MQAKVKLNLVGFDGNAFAIMGAFSKAARQQGWTKTEIDSVLNRAMNSNYDNLLGVISHHCVDIEEDDDENEEM